MIAVVQLVDNAQVKIFGNSENRGIQNGLVVYLAIKSGDTELDVQKMAEKISKLRIFPDHQDKMNLSILDTKGDILLIPQFTLVGDIKGSNRPSFPASADRETAISLIKLVKNILIKKDITVIEGFFGEHMQISQVNNGPVTIIIDTSDL